MSRAVAGKKGQTHLFITFIKYAYICIRICNIIGRKMNKWDGLEMKWREKGGRVDVFHRFELFKHFLDKGMEIL